MLVLEDVHAADESSLLLLRFVARTVTDARLLVIATTRSSDRSATEPFAGTLADLARAQRFRHIRLGGLSREEVTHLVAATRDVAAPEALVDRIYTRTDGHPFFVSEIVHLLATDSDVDVLPQEVRAVVSQRLGMLSKDCQQLLALASVVGPEFSTEVLATASGDNSASVVDDLQEAVVISMLLAVPPLQAATVSRTSWFARCFTTSCRPLAR